MVARRKIFVFVVAIQHICLSLWFHLDIPVLMARSAAQRVSKQRRNEQAKRSARLEELAKRHDESRKSRLAKRKAKVARKHGLNRVADAFDRSAIDPSVTFAPFGRKFRSERGDVQAAINASDDMLRKIEEVGVDDSHLVQLHSLNIDWGDLSETTTSEFGVSAISKGLREARKKVAKTRREARRRKRREEATDTDDGVDARPKRRKRAIDDCFPYDPDSIPYDLFASGTVNSSYFVQNQYFEHLESHLPTPTNQLHEALKIAGNGETPSIEMYDTPEIQGGIKNFLAELSSLETLYCSCCHHRWWDVKIADEANGICVNCVKTKEQYGAAHFGADNDMDPRPLPEHLPRLSTVEEMIVSLVCPVMKAYRLKGGMLGYKGNVINFSQDVVEFAKSLPRRVNEVPVVVVRRKKGASPTEHADFRVRRDNIRQWLEFLFENHPEYSFRHRGNHLVFDNEALNSLPEDGNVADQVDAQYEDADNAEADGVAKDAKESSAAGANSGEEDDDPLNNGPEQGEGTGGNDDMIETLGMTSAATHIRETAKEFLMSALQENAEVLDEEEAEAEGRVPVVQWPKQSSGPISEFDTIRLMSMAFPTLFPYGKGDSTNPERHHRISFSQSVKHYHRYAMKRNGSWIYPFG